MDRPDKIEIGMALRRQYDRRFALAEFSFDVGRFLAHAAMIAGKVAWRLE